MMGMHVTDKELQKLIKSIGYKGCKNCKHQISPLRSCEWSERGGDGQIHFVCPKWDKVESEDEVMKIENLSEEEMMDRLLYKEIQEADKMAEDGMIAHDIQELADQWDCSLERIADVLKQMGVGKDG